MTRSQGVTRQSTLAHRTRREPPAGEPSRNARILERAGYVDKLMAGVYSFLPLGLRVLRNIEDIVRDEMTAVGGNEVLMPALHPIAAWEATGRQDMPILFRTGGDTAVLGPTHEEVVTPLMAAQVASYKDLPTAVFQIQNKFRDEARPKSGLLRGREFGMKDMYSFHLSGADLETYYEQVADAYRRVFARCGLGEVTHYTYASGGDFCEFSHEFQAVTPHGEDTVYLDHGKGTAINKEILDRYTPEEIAELEPVRAIEVGNIFKLGTRFADAVGFRLPDATGVPQRIHMGCYGIGTTRLVGAIAEILSTDDAMVWPAGVAPYAVHVIPLSAQQHQRAEEVAAALHRRGHTVLLDDRPARAGAKLADADLIGIPHRAVVGARTEEGRVEHSDRLADVTRTVPVAELAQLVTAV
ncbi:aminoacyl--tRNA ligase-related protein [Phytomonospora sp. NPDC050363]|uniref:aminoacyl--tRNA ligase-related protein n=1 Tax=Phytomonospora sp. NPDC050363 TaxID=3155642 RepID=UPI0033C79FCB